MRDYGTSIITTHAKKRIKQRLGISKKLSKSIVKKALEKGIHHDELKGNLKIYIDEIHSQTHEATTVKILNDYIYLFKGIILITVMKLPNEYKSELAKIIKKKKE